jgi:hypothetical protein
MNRLTLVRIMGIAAADVIYGLAIELEYSLVTGSVMLNVDEVFLS